MAVSRLLQVTDERTPAPHDYLSLAGAWLHERVTADASLS
jgi:hypothetical protein